MTLPCPAGTARHRYYHCIIIPQAWQQAKAWPRRISAPKQRPPHGGDEPDVFRTPGRHRRELRHTGRAKAKHRLALAKALREAGIRVCFETNGHICDAELIAAGDIVCDVKNQETDDLSVYERFFEECVRQGKVARVTNVLLPGVNDGEGKIAALARLVHRFFPAERIRFLPFRKLCEQKYAELGIPFPCAAVREAEEEDVARAERIAQKAML